MAQMLNSIVLDPLSNEKTSEDDKEKVKKSSLNQI